jgi:hypothetical protein
MAPPNQTFLAKAEALKPTLTETIQHPIALVRTIADPTLPLGWRIETDAPIEALATRTYKRGDSFIVDFGGHRTGHLSFHLTGVGRGVDAPVRLRLTFGEVVTDVAEPFHPFHGMLSESWLPEEIITIDFLPQPVHLPRRYAFRFVKFDIIDTSPNFSARFEDLQAHALTSAQGTMPPLPANYPADLQRIDAVAAATLRDCMQTVFEDGPRRDQRLWMGDARLQALASYATFPNLDLVRRCLYLFAAYTRADGLIAADVYEKPVTSHGNEFLPDYCLFFVAALNDYLQHTSDTALPRELWPTAKRQIEILSQYVQPNGVFLAPRNLWVFIDWHPSLERTAAMHAVFLFGLRQALDLSQRLGLASETAHYPVLIERLEAAALTNFYDAPSGLFLSGDNRQVSLASQAWMALAEVGTLPVRQLALTTALARQDAIRPVTPFLYHYIVEALLVSNLHPQALTLLRTYWGGMIQAGADTFWEAYAPETPRLAPYGDFHINSFCHAWSCTPSYLLRKYPLPT